MEKEQQTTEKQRGMFPTWGDLLVMIAIFFGISIVVGIVMTVVSLVWPNIQKELVTAILYATQFGLSIWIIWLYRKNRGAKENVFRFDLRWYNASLVVLGIILLAAGSVVLEPVLSLFPDKYFEILNEAIGSGGWPILTTVVMAPVFEEMLFRGLILESIRQKRNSTYAVMVSALMFGLVHAPILPQMLNAFVMGVMLGYVYVLTGSLVSVIIIHAVNNALSYLVMEITGNQQVELRDMIGNDLLYWIIFGVSVVVFVGIMVWMALLTTKKRQQESEFAAIFADVSTAEAPIDTPEGQ
jgi:membrane protease YdiL (CAAX protease family)